MTTKSETPTQPDISEGGMSEPDFADWAQCLHRFNTVEQCEKSLRAAFRQGREHERNLKGNGDE